MKYLNFQGEKEKTNTVQLRKSRLSYPVSIPLRNFPRGFKTFPAHASIYTNFMNNKRKIPSLNIYYPSFLRATLLLAFPSYLAFHFPPPAPSTLFFLFLFPYSSFSLTTFFFFYFVISIASGQSQQFSDSRRRRVEKKKYERIFFFFLPRGSASSIPNLNVPCERVSAFKAVRRKSYPLSEFVGCANQIQVHPDMKLFWKRGRKKFSLFLFLLSCAFTSAVNHLFR